MRRRIAVAVVLGVIASAIGIALGLTIHWFPTHASTQADKISTLYDVLIIATVPVFVLVVGVVLFSVFEFRMRPGQENQDGAPIHGSTRLEVIWVTVPAALILGLCVYAYVVLRDIERKPAQAAQEMQVKVIGQQFAWSFEYPKSMTGGKQLTTNQLYLPINRSVEFRITAKDVLHDFWVPSFSVKMDAVPGITTHYRVTPNRLGNYPIVCAELCGLGHSVMRSTVHVLPQPAFDAWLKKQGQPLVAAGAGPDKVAAAGKQVFLGGSGCSGCHTLADAGATATIGPDLGTALKGQSAAMLRQDVVDPNAVGTKGYPPNVMPKTFGKTLSPDELKALVAYLGTVSAK